MRTELPTGTVTFLFTDVEGSTRLLHELGAETYAGALAEHRRLIRGACARHNGIEVDTQGDAFFFSFPTAPGALSAAGEMTEALASGPIQVRIGLHTGTPLLTNEGYVGPDTHRAARIAAAGHGGQVLVSASNASLVDQDQLRDLGQHRLKDLSAAERIYQLGDDAFPPLKALHQTNLPVPSTPFLGREKELAEVGHLLALRDVRLLTLTGPGGTGKTRLAAQSAGWVADGFSDGVWWVPLEALRDPALVVESAAQAMGAKRELRAHIGDKRMLILFDGFERVVEGAGALADVLAVCPNLKLLVTSRERLHLTGEQEYSVPPFAHEEAVGFFTARARTVKPDFVADEAVSGICYRLDDLPLALELAAARVKVLSSHQILGRLEKRLPLLSGGARDLPDRQRTLRATIDWSHELLDEDEQKLFRCLSVFAGGWTLEAAEEVVGADLDTLQSLVDKSLLRRTRERYRMLDTISEYARTRLDESGEAEEQHVRHADYFLAFAEAVGGMHLHEGTQAFAIERLADELSNLRAAIEWSLETRRYETVLRFGSALWLFWSVRGHAAEGRRMLEPAVMAANRETDEWLGGATAFGELERMFGKPERARTLKEELLPLLRHKGETRMVAGTLADLGDLAIDDGDYERARQLLEESLSLRSPGAHGGRGRTLSSLGHLALREGDLEQAEALLQESAENHAAVDPGGSHTAWSLWALADVRRRRKDHPGAEKAFRDSLGISGVLGDAAGVADCLEGLAEIALERGHDDRADRLRGTAERLREAVDTDEIQHRLDEALASASNS